jgi:hypothetical protein
MDSQQRNEDGKVPNVDHKTAVLGDLLSNNKMLDPHDRSLGYEFGLDLQLQHISLDTTELEPEESALRILDSIASRDSKAIEQHESST